MGQLCLWTGCVPGFFETNIVMVVLPRTVIVLLCVCRYNALAKVGNVGQSIIVKCIYGTVAGILIGFLPMIRQASQAIPCSSP